LIRIAVSYGVEPICRALPNAPSTNFMSVWHSKCDPSQSVSHGSSRDKAMKPTRFGACLMPIFQVYSVRQVWRQMTA
jgi:hypothetical protein